MKGKIIFDPPNKTKKHERQSSWKKVAIVEFKGETSNMWRWFIKKRYGLILNTSVRADHITFVNDVVGDEMRWDLLKESLNGKIIDVQLTSELRSDGKHWWLKPNFVEEFDLIRGYLNLGEMYFPPHFTVGYANDLNLKHSEYIKKICIKFGNI